jgi:Ca-activated chloride channel homolog
MVAVGLTIALSLTTLAQTGNPPAPPAQKEQETAKKDKKDAPPGQGMRKLSRRERKERTAKLEDHHRLFLDDVQPIITQAELDSFLLLDNDAQREAFMVDFWRRRDTSGGTNDAFRNAYYSRLQIVKERFRRTGSDRAKTFLLHGPPVGAVKVDCDRLLQPLEVWQYGHIPGVGDDIRLLFYQPRGHNDFKLWNPIGGSMALSELIANDSITFGPGEDQSKKAFDSNSPYSYVSKIQLSCREGDEVVKAITQMIQNRVELMHVFEPAPVNEEDVKRILRTLVIENPDAPKLTAEFSVRYPSKEGSRTDAQMMLLIPRAELTPSVVGEEEVYTVDVTGEILRDGKLWERYRYRFDFPGDTKGDKLPIVIDRLLRPSEYTSRVKVVDASTGAEALIESDLVVPEIFEPEPVAEPVQIASVTPKAAEMQKPVAELKKELVTKEARLRIIPPNEEVVNGLQTIETLISGDTIRAVEFWLDGKKIAIRRQPPFTLDLDFGNVPQMRRIRAIGLGLNDEPITGDDITVNTGTDPFRVRITSPRIAPKLAGPTRVDIDVSLPDGEELGALELYWNDRRMATMYDAPFVHTVDIPATEGVGYLRAVATLKDTDQPPIEDVVLINTPAYMEELNVHLIELPTTVLVGGKPSNHLTEKSFKVLDEGKPVAISKFEYVKNLPLSLGMAFDTSGSMMPRMDEAQKAGAQFFQNVMRKGDKAFLVGFDSQPQLVQRWSTKIGDIHAGLAKLRPEESTALYDAVVYALYNFLGIKGQKALIVISDGKDTASKFTFDQAVEYARRAAVPIYAIGIGIRGNEIDVRYKLGKLASETGGSTYYIEAAKDLGRIYDDIQTELRSQYVIGFYPAADVKAGSKWREITVQASEGKAKTIRGYYP